MRGAAVSLTSAASGFLVFLLSVPVIQGQDERGVTYSSTEICALKGSTVEINCTYRYPPRTNPVAIVLQIFWFAGESNYKPVDLRTDSEYAGRVQYYCDENICTLRITDLRESDSTVYKIKFITNQTAFTGLPGVTLSVTDPDLQVQVITSAFRDGFHLADLKCHTSCHLPDHSSYIWYKNGQKIQTETSSSYSGSFYPADSYSCALKGREDFPSPSVCVLGQSCNRVMFTERSICVLKGSSVNISCTYNSYGNITFRFWFNPERSDQWQNPSQPEDLREDSQYAGRVQVLETERGRSTLRITDLRESDSAQYHFKFKTGSFEWRSSLPGTTLTVTALQVQVTRVTVHPFYTEAELKCHSSCSPAGRLSYIWFNNGEKITGEETSSYKGRFSLGDNISCALKGHEDFPSPSVYAPKTSSVSVSPSGEIVEGSSVTLTCSSDANPAANYTWYKENQTLLQGPSYHFTSIRSEDRGIYYCKSENQHGQSVFIDVQYAPKLPSVSVSPSGEIVEGSSVNLTCSSDANPAANYTWYKENEDSPKASGQIFTITDFRPEHSGNYYCEAQNRRGHHNSTFHLIVVSGAWKSTVIGTIIAVVLAVILLSVFILIRKKRASKQSSELGERPDDSIQCLSSQSKQEENDDLCHASIQFSKNQTDSLYSNRHKEEEDKSIESQESAGEDTVAFYSTINKTC